MPCYHPLPAWRTHSKEVFLGKERPDSTRLNLPCGGCLGCQMNKARGWALRCQLEMQQHDHAVFTTLTYADEHLPPTLRKNELSEYVRSVRKRLNPRSKTNRTLVRFFASGEYGEQLKRPHYHLILYGIRPDQAQLLDEAWGKGFTTVEPITPARIAYCAGYTAKKNGDGRYRYERDAPRLLDPTGTYFYSYQRPFIQMSRNPGIGGHARQWANSWRIQAVNNGTTQPVPRFLHEAWKQQATEEEKEELIREKTQLAALHINNTERLHAAKKIAEAQLAIRNDKRRN